MMVKTALITGATGGIGRAFAHLLAEKGMHLVLSAGHEGALATLGRELKALHGVEVTCLTQDLSVPGAAQALFDASAALNLEIDMLINNAGFGDFGRFATSDLWRQSEMIQVNIAAMMALCHVFMRPMIARGYGRILNTASLAAFQPGPLMAVYYASKAFVLSFSEALAVELRGSGVTVTALCPGPTRTGFEARASLTSSRLFKRLVVASPDRVAAYGYRRMMKGCAIAIPGVQNRVVASLTKLSPRRWVRQMVYQIQKPQKQSSL